MRVLELLNLELVEADLVPELRVGGGLLFLLDLQDVLLVLRLEGIDLEGEQALEVGLLGALLLLEGVDLIPGQAQGVV